MNITEVREVLVRRAKHTGGQKQLAELIGISESFMSEIIRGSREPGSKTLAYLKLVKVVRYEHG